MREAIGCIAERYGLQLFTCCVLSVVLVQVNSKAASHFLFVKKVIYSPNKILSELHTRSHL